MTQVRFNNSLSFFMPLILLILCTYLELKFLKAYFDISDVCTSLTAVCCTSFKSNSNFFQGTSACWTDKTWLYLIYYGSLVMPWIQAVIISFINSFLDVARLFLFFPSGYLNKDKALVPTRLKKLSSKTLHAPYQRAQHLVRSDSGALDGPFVCNITLGCYSSVIW